jgi:uncharacterized protein Usg
VEPNCCEATSIRHQRQASRNETLDGCKNPVQHISTDRVQTRVSSGAVREVIALGVFRRGESNVAQLNLMLKGYRLTTAEILYHMPDHPKLLQSFVWQELDLAPQFPVLGKFLSFWNKNLEGRLHSVRVGTCGILCPLDIRHVGHEISIH